MDLVDRFIDLATRPVPLRSILMRKMIGRLKWGTYKVRLDGGAVQRPYYGLCLYQAAETALALGYRSVTAVELGVAGGNGLVNMCDHAEEISSALGIDVRLVGFDSGQGLPVSNDPRDVRYYWPGGSFPMDRAALERRLAGRAELVLGDVVQTLTEWRPAPDAPLGAVLFDLDLYTSTKAGLRILLNENVLPRVWCYFDDVEGYPINAFGDGAGERAALAEFNAASQRSELQDYISPARVFKNMTPEAWQRRIYIYHRFSHPQYNANISGQAKHELRLSGG